MLEKRRHVLQPVDGERTLRRHRQSILPVRRLQIAERFEDPDQPLDPPLGRIGPICQRLHVERLFLDILEQPELHRAEERPEMKHGLHVDHQPGHHAAANEKALDQVGLEGHDVRLAFGERTQKSTPTRGGSRGAEFSR